MTRDSTLEMDCDIPLDADRVIPPPLPDPVVEVDPELRAAVLLAGLTFSASLICFGVWLVLR